MLLVIHSTLFRDGQGPEDYIGSTFVPLSSEGHVATQAYADSLTPSFAPPLSIVYSKGINTNTKSSYTPSKEESKKSSQRLKGKTHKRKIEQPATDRSSTSNKDIASNT
ncbi:hypothetical protein PanWU01x14_270030 [Parasponia andersonii]|uniref:Uncharacterized protein n=1 Tax=Parasponia andersonii TaxID=3476 RepID=A0A2P5B5J9_PARAD|nr:hypothetical protein PanWU01x14_270030 [Parasponia andersonii]